VILRARILLPVFGPPVEDGAVLISENQIVAVGPWSDLRPHTTESAIDLGDSILLPGLINSHCHLDYSNMSGIPAPKAFPDWIKALMALKSGTIYTDYAESWLRGAAMLLRTGTTTVADIEAVPELLPDVWSATPLRVASFLEMTGVKSARNPTEILDEAASKIASLHPQRGLAGLSPHALYSTTPELLRQTAQLARQKNWRVTMHVAESPDEFEMYVHQRGHLIDWLMRQRDMSDCGHGTPVAQIHRCGLLGENFLAVHANYLLPTDIQLLAQTGCSVVHCPRSHSYFQYQPFQARELAAAGVNLCLGTDSLASMPAPRRAPPELNMFTEMRLFAANFPDVPPASILEMATVNGAQALGWQGRVGQLVKDSLADLITIPFSGAMADAYTAVVHHPGEIAASMVDGRWQYPPS
jgi:cytosine/adenosine deaminase-related metal-dependent hydrolase